MTSPSLPSFKHLKVSYTKPGVAEVLLARPPANAVNRDMYIEIEELFTKPDRIGEGLQVIILAGEGAHFCAGNDLGEFATRVPLPMPSARSARASAAESRSACR
jgi:enoyl-CoA hydratase/carnithine racemase